MTKNEIVEAQRLQSLRLATDLVARIAYGAKLVHQDGRPYVPGQYYKPKTLSLVSLFIPRMVSDFRRGEQTSHLENSDG